MDCNALSRMSQLETVAIHDDWTGVTDPKERRKRQNRVRQRALRRRRAAERDASSPEDPSDLHITIFSVKSFTPGAPSTKNPKPIKLDENDHPDRKPVTAKTPPRSTATTCGPLIPYVDGHHTKRARLHLVFPLSPDHHLITLAQYNTVRALLTNTSIMALSEIIPSRCQALLDIALLPDRPRHLPPALQPTEIQKLIPHDPGLDVIPCPAMRDTMILQEGQYDEEELYRDCVGGLHEGFDDIELRGILVWSDPWSPDGWEVTEGFCKKWGFLLEGCDDLMRATNRWRARRGLDPLTVTVFG